MYPRPLPQKHPPPNLLLAEMIRRSAAHEVVHVSAALAHVVVAVLPTVGREVVLLIPSLM
eukprot:3497496-Pleurochrysis_carterae.AAC.1